MSEWNEQDHPRKRAGSAGGHGGEFEDKPVVGDDMDLADEPTGAATPTAELALAFGEYGVDEVARTDFTLPDGHVVSGWAGEGVGVRANMVPPGWRRWCAYETDEGLVLTGDEDFGQSQRFSFLTDDPRDMGGDRVFRDEDWAHSDEMLTDSLGGEWEREDLCREVADRTAERAMDAERTADRVELLRTACNWIMEDEPDHGTLGTVQVLASDEADDWLETDRLDPEELAEKRRCGGWDPAKHPYMHVNEDGDYVGLTAEQAANRLWEHRRDIIEAFGEDRGLRHRTLMRLANAF